MAIYDVPTGRFATQTLDEIDYVANGDVYHGVHTSNILVGSESDLAQLTGYTPGSIAHTAGWASMWELDIDGATWVPIQE